MSFGVSMHSLESSASLINEVIHQSKQDLIEALGKLVSDGILSIETTEPVMVKNDFNGKLEFRRQVNVVLSEQMAINNLRARNMQLEEEVKFLKRMMEFLTSSKEKNDNQSPQSPSTPV